jgi:hypothetical protein
MTERRWRPLDVRESGSATSYDGPFEGVPDWLFVPLWDWVDNQMPALWTGRQYSKSAVSFYREMAVSLRTRFDGGDVSGRELHAGLYTYVCSDPIRVLAVADYLLFRLDRHDAGAAAQARRLHDLLRAGGSAYEVQSDDQAKYYLSRRVSQEARAAADEVLAAADKAAQHLSRAWRAVYGQSPSPGVGYGETIKAIEAAAIPVVSPENGRATLGTVIRDLRAAPEKWTIGLHNPDRTAQVTALADTLDLLWEGPVPPRRPKSGRPARCNPDRSGGCAPPRPGAGQVAQGRDGSRESAAIGVAGLQFCSRRRRRPAAMPPTLGAVAVVRTPNGASVPTGPAY